MFKAVNNLREQKGFTLIELLIVIAIIGILAAIAIPAFLGQREKAKIRSVEASAKGAVSELQSILDAFVAAEPYVLLVDNAGNPQEKCYESSNAFGAKTCSSMYSDVIPPVAAAVGTYNNIDDVRLHFIDHHKAKNERSPYQATSFMFVIQNPGGQVAAPGQIGIQNIGARSFSIKAYAEDRTLNKEIFKTTVTAR